MKEIDEQLKYGIIAEAFNAEYNLHIWRYVADEIENLKKEDEHIKKLFSFIQRSAQNNFILALARLYDRPNKKYPTKCFEKFLSLVKINTFSMKRVVETYQTLVFLKEYNCPQYLTDALQMKDSSDFYEMFCSYYEGRYKSSEFQYHLRVLRNYRDKAIAHNETFEVSIHNDSLEALRSFAEEVYVIFDMACNSRTWKLGNSLTIKRDAEHNAYFVQHTIDLIKQNRFENGKLLNAS